MNTAKPSTDDMRLAAEWLGEYEESPEGEACARVAEWLVEQANAKDLRDAAREHGVPVHALRRKLAASCNHGHQHDTRQAAKACNWRNRSLLSHNPSPKE